MFLSEPLDYSLLLFFGDVWPGRVPVRTVSPDDLLSSLLIEDMVFFFTYLNLFFSLRVSAFFNYLLGGRVFLSPTPLKISVSLLKFSWVFASFVPFSLSSLSDSSLLVFESISESLSLFRESDSSYFFSFDTYLWYRILSCALSGTLYSLSVSAYD